nr:leucine-rich repeat domain-containing protein [uncultured Ruminococcus sp.]
MKKLLALLLTLIMAVSVVSIVPTVSAEETVYTSGDFQYVKLNDKNIKITRYIGEGLDVVIPSKLDNYTVTRVGENLFYYNREVTSVSFPDSIKKLEQYALNGARKIKKVTFGKYVTEIPVLFLRHCSGIKSYTVPPQITKLSASAFPMELKSLTIGRGVKTIKNEGGFHLFVPLEEIKVSRNNKYFSSKDGVLYNKKKTKLIVYPGGKKSAKFTIPNSVKFVHNGGFKWSKYLRTVTLGKNIKKIGNDAFINCYKLSLIKIPKNVTGIGEWAFRECTSVTKLTINANKNLKIGDEAFSYLTKIKTLKVPKVSGYGVFRNCYNLSSISIPSNVKTLTNEEFISCEKLKKVTIPKTVKKIGERALGYIESEYDGRISKVKGFTIRGYKGSAGEKYAKKNGFKFVKIG